MKIIGVTGGVGMGKSTSAQHLAERGVKVIDTDVLARDVVETGQPALAELAKAFGAEIINGGGRLRRDELARRVFSNADERRRLEAIVHPRIREKWIAKIQQWRDQDIQTCAVIIPLLFETHAEREFDAVICVACSVATQQQRLAKRGWDSREIEQRIAAQWPIEKKIALSDFVIWTEVSINVHRQQLDRILASISGV